MPSAIVVGGGLSGLSAAHTLLQNGCHVTLLDKNPFLGGNSTKATSGINGAGTRTQGKMGVDDSVDVFLEDMVRSATGVKTGPCPEPYPLARVVAGDSPHAVHWIQDSFGVPLDTVSRMGGHSNQRCHRTKAGGKFPGMEITSALMKRFEKMADAEDGTCDLIINAVAKKLVKDESGRVVGIEYVDADGELKQAIADGVVLATGGYGAGGAVPGSVLHQIRPDLVHLPTTNGDHSQGDGIQLAMDIGAKTIGLKHVQVHPTGLVNPADPDNRTKFLAAEALRGEGGIILDNEGKRFCNDIGKRDYVTGRMWEHNKGPYRLILNSKSAGNMAWHCKHYCSRRVMKHMKTGSDLAKEIGIPVSQLKASFDAYNGHAEAHSAGKPTDPFGKVYFTNYHMDINDSFYVAQITPVVHYTMGGLAITTKAECIYDGVNRVIPGLFAAGELTGGVHGRNRLGGSGLLECVVFGRVAGSACAEYVKQPPPPVSLSGGGKGTTTTITIPQNNGADPITITYSSNGGGGDQPGEVLGEKVDVLEWEDEATTQVGKLTAGADGGAPTDVAKSESTTTGSGGGGKVDTTGADVAVVFGSFFMGDSESDAKMIVKLFPKCDLDAPAQPFTGNDFNFNSLKNTKYLVVCTSSMYGNPPKNFWEFYYHLKQASENPNKPLKGLQHTVYGNGDETYYDTYMNVPRMIDQLLEKAGSRRFFARGETGEPHPSCPDESEMSSEEWIPKMLECIATNPKLSDPPVAWNELWKGSKPQHHDKVTDWPLKKLEKKFGKPDSPSIFATLTASL